MELEVGRDGLPRIDGGRWRLVSRLTAGSSPASISNTDEEGRRWVYVMTCHHDRTVIERSTAGVDFEVPALGSDNARVIVTKGMQMVALLAVGASWQMDVLSDPGAARSRGRVRTRWTHRSTEGTPA